MKVYTNGYGLVEFTPKEVYRLNGERCHTQLRGLIRVNNLYRTVASLDGKEWIPLNYWFSLNEIDLYDTIDSINEVIGLPVLTEKEAYVTNEESTCTCPLCSGTDPEKKTDLNDKINDIIEQQIDLVSDALSVTSSDDLVWDSAVTKQHSHLISTLGILKSMV